MIPLPIAPTLSEVRDSRPVLAPRQGRLAKGKEFIEIDQWNQLTLF